MNFELAGAQNGADRSEFSLKTEFAIEGAGGVILGADHDKRLVAASRDLFGEPTCEIYPIPFPAEFRAGLHREHGSVVRLYHPCGKLAFNEDAVSW